MTDEATRSPGLTTISTGCWPTEFVCRSGAGLLTTYGQTWRPRIWFGF
jgi:hypothetical protein